MNVIKVDENWNIQIGENISVYKLKPTKKEKDNGTINLNQYRDIKNNNYEEPKFIKYTVVLGEDNIIRVVSVARSTPIKLPNHVKEALLKAVYQEHGKGMYQFLK